MNKRFTKNGIEILPWCDFCETHMDHSKLKKVLEDKKLKLYLHACSKCIAEQGLK